MKGNIVEALIGAVVLLVAGLFVWLVTITTDVAGVDGYRLTARFDKVGALALGSDVRLSGIKVGSVVGQDLDPRSFQAVVTFTVDQRLELPEDTYAKIASEGLLGGTYIALEPGGSPENIPPGGQVEFTEGYVDLFSLVSRFAFSGDGGDGNGAGDESEE
ncbi:MAG: outer membrane lipid asymmetry maintenance protein MlaD [Rhodothalassiaceae bacterium]